jgi:hypothetical protein
MRTSLSSKICVQDQVLALCRAVLLLGSARLCTLFFNCTKYSGPKKRRCVLRGLVKKIIIIRRFSSERVDTVPNRSSSRSLEFAQCPPLVTWLILCDGFKFCCTQDTNPALLFDPSLVCGAEFVFLVPQQYSGLFLAQVGFWGLHPDSTPLSILVLWTLGTGLKTG